MAPPPRQNQRTPLSAFKDEAPLPLLESDLAMYKLSTGILASLLLSIGSAHAAPADDACAALMEARGHLVAMIGSADQAAYPDLKAKIYAASDKVDAVVNAMQKSYNVGNEAQAAAFKPVWEVFKATRNNEIIPAMFAGKVADAKALASGIQAERMKQMRGALNCK